MACSAFPARESGYPKPISQRSKFPIQRNKGRNVPSRYHQIETVINWMALFDGHRERLSKEGARLYEIIGDSNCILNDGCAEC